MDDSLPVVTNLTTSIAIIFASTKFLFSNSYNHTVTNVTFKTKYPSNCNFQLVVCISCTLENITLTGYGLLFFNLIRRPYLNIVINLIKSPYTALLIIK